MPSAGGDRAWIAELPIPQVDRDLATGDSCPSGIALNQYQMV